MKPTELEIEAALRRAPQPSAPSGLKAQLTRQITLSARSPAVQPVPERSERVRSLVAPSLWLRAWWPALTAACLTLACAVTLAVQQTHIRELRRAVEELRATPAPKPAPAQPPPADTGADDAAKGRAEIQRLTALARQLTAEVGALEKLGAENRSLREQLAARAALPPEVQSEFAALAAAKEKADRSQCVNHLKQLGLAARIWGGDHGDISPPDILSMSNEVNMPMVLVCPADQGRQPATNWASFTSANCSYEYLAPSAPFTEPQRVMLRCPIHGSVTLCDGSVQQGVAKNHPESLVQRDGKLYLEPNRGGQEAAQPTEKRDALPPGAATPPATEPPSH